MMTFILTVVCVEKSMPGGITGKNSAALGKRDSEWSGCVLAPGVGF